MTVKTTKNDLKTDLIGSKGCISKNTYYMLPNWFIALALTKKYQKISKKDLKKGYYFLVTVNNMTLRIPFKAIFGTNSKIKGIKSLDFSNASLCESFRLGYCRIPHKNWCYAFVFENQYKTSHNGFYFKFNAYFKGFLMHHILRLLENKAIRTLFFKYIDENISILRFNVNSDFRNLKDFNLLLDISVNCKNTVIYGYTARNDLLIDYNDNKDSYTNLTINGSNMVYDNQYKAVFSLKEYYMASFKCIGECLICGKCFKLKNKVITTLFHNSKADSILNTLENRLFIVDIFKERFNIDLKDSDLKVNKGLYHSLNKVLSLKYKVTLKDYDIEGLKDLMDALDCLNDIIADSMALNYYIDYKGLNLF